MNTMKLCLGLWAACAIPAVACAQGDSPSGTQIPIRKLGAITATSKDSLGAQVAIRVLSNGAVLVNDVARRRVVMLDASLGHLNSVIDSAGTTGSAMATAIPSAQLIRYLGDSTLYVDIATQALLVLDPMGKVARVMALPRPTDAILIALGQLGPASIDRLGRLIYRGQFAPKVKAAEPGSSLLASIPVSPDSGPILRADFDSRRVDTLGTIKVVAPGATTISRDGQGNMTTKITLNVLDTADEWAMLPDGTIAILRAHDYHIDWINTDSSRRSSPKLPFDWRRLSDEAKQTKIDSVKALLEKQVASRNAMTIPTPDGPRKVKTEFEFEPISKMTDYEPPIAPGAMKADLAGNLWIVPRTSASADGGLLYDVVNAKGVLTHRVQFPKGYALAGFGSNGDVYLLRVEGKVGFLEKARVP